MHDPTFEIPRATNKNEEFQYISIILKNRFTVSGKYQSGENIWITNNKGPKNIIKLKENREFPKQFTEKLTNWRGANNVDNKYCNNNGGTPSRCDLNYNGNKLTAIGLDKDLIETSGDSIKYIFYNLELNPPINISPNNKSFIDIRYQRNLEVYGNGKDVKSISIAPIIFRVLYRQNNL